MTKQAKQVCEAAKHIAKKAKVRPEIGLILGSGLGILADTIEKIDEIPYADIPYFPVPTVAGHEGVLVIGKMSGTIVLTLKGRFHLYEGHSAETVTFPIQVMKALGTNKLVVTNAAGGINTSYRPGDLMLIRDHINGMFRDSLRGLSTSPLSRPHAETYSHRLRGIAKQVASQQGMTLREGVYIGVLGPSYETPAEIRMMRRAGADAVGMSTVPEVTAARHLGMETIGISCITNMAAGVLDGPLSHAEVMETAEKAKDSFIKLVSGIIPNL